MKMKILRLLLLLNLFAPSLMGEDGGVEDELRELIHDYGMKGFTYLQINPNLDSAEFYLQKALNLQLTTPGYPIDDRVAANYILLAAVYSKIFNNKQALESLTEAEKILTT